MRLQEKDIFLDSSFIPQQRHNGMTENSFSPYTASQFTDDALLKNGYSFLSEDGQNGFIRPDGPVEILSPTSGTNEGGHGIQVSIHDLGKEKFDDQKYCILEVFDRIREEFKLNSAETRHIPVKFLARSAFMNLRSCSWLEMMRQNVIENCRHSEFRETYQLDPEDVSSDLIAAFVTTYIDLATSGMSIPEYFRMQSDEQVKSSEQWYNDVRVELAARNNDVLGKVVARRACENVIDDLAKASLLITVANFRAILAGLRRPRSDSNATQVNSHSLPNGGAPMELESRSSMNRGMISQFAVRAQELYSYCNAGRFVARQMRSSYNLKSSKRQVSKTGSHSRQVTEEVEFCHFTHASLGLSVATFRMMMDDDYYNVRELKNVFLGIVDSCLALQNIDLQAIRSMFQRIDCFVDKELVKPAMVSLFLELGIALSGRVARTASSFASGEHQPQEHQKFVPRGTHCAFWASQNHCENAIGRPDPLYYLAYRPNEAEDVQHFTTSSSLNPGHWVYNVDSEQCSTKAVSASLSIVDNGLDMQHPVIATQKEALGLLSNVKQILSPVCGQEWPFVYSGKYTALSCIPMLRMTARHFADSPDVLDVLESLEIDLDTNFEDALPYTGKSGNGTSANSAHIHIPTPAVTKSHVMKHREDYIHREDALGITAATSFVPVEPAVSNATAKKSDKSDVSSGVKKGRQYKQSFRSVILRMKRRKLLELCKEYGVETDETMEEQDLRQLLMEANDEIQREQMKAELAEKGKQSEHPIFSLMHSWFNPTTGPMTVECSAEIDRKAATLHALPDFLTPHDHKLLWCEQVGFVLNHRYPNIGTAVDGACVLQNLANGAVSNAIVVIKMEDSDRNQKRLSEICSTHGRFVKESRESRYISLTPLADRIELLHACAAWEVGHVLLVEGLSNEIELVTVLNFPADIRESYLNLLNMGDECFFSWLHGPADLVPEGPLAGMAWNSQGLPSRESVQLYMAIWELLQSLLNGIDNLVLPACLSLHPRVISELEHYNPLSCGTQALTRQLQAPVVTDAHQSTFLELIEHAASNFAILYHWSLAEDDLREDRITNLTQLHAFLDAQQSVAPFRPFLHKSVPFIYAACSVDGDGDKNLSRPEQSALQLQAAVQPSRHLHLRREGEGSPLLTAASIHAQAAAQATQDRTGQQSHHSQLQPQPQPQPQPHSQSESRSQSLSAWEPALFRREETPVAQVDSLTAVRLLTEEGEPDAPTPHSRSALFTPPSASVPSSLPALSLMPPFNLNSAPHERSQQPHPAPPFSGVMPLNFNLNNISIAPSSTYPILARNVPRYSMSMSPSMHDYEGSFMPEPLLGSYGALSDFEQAFSSEQAEMPPPRDKESQTRPGNLSASAETYPTPSQGDRAAVAKSPALTAGPKTVLETTLETTEETTEETATETHPVAPAHIEAEGALEAGMQPEAGAPLVGDIQPDIQAEVNVALEATGMEEQEQEDADEVEGGMHITEGGESDDDLHSPRPQYSPTPPMNGDGGPSHSHSISSPDMEGDLEGCDGASQWLSAPGSYSPSMSLSADPYYSDDIEELLALYRSWVASLNESGKGLSIFRQFNTKGTFEWKIRHLKLLPADALNTTYRCFCHDHEEIYNAQTLLEEEDNIYGGENPEQDLSWELAGLVPAVSKSVLGKGKGGPQGRNLGESPQKCAYCSRTERGVRLGKLTSEWCVTCQVPLCRLPYGINIFTGGTLPSCYELWHEQGRMIRPDSEQSPIRMYVKLWEQHMQPRPSKKSRTQVIVQDLIRTCLGEDEDIGMGDFESYNEDFSDMDSEELM
jgi:hypothetical protein